MESANFYQSKIIKDFYSMSNDMTKPDKKKKKIGMCLR